MILYQPKEEQHYYYLGEDRTQVWFVHFSGRDVRKILQTYGIPVGGNILRTGLSGEYEDFFRKMRDELVARRWGYEEMLSYLFRELLMTMHRRMEEDPPRFSGFTSQEIDLAKDYFTEHYNEEISIEEYARSRHVSTSWFNKSFKSALGTTPMSYILSIRIRNAQILLETTDYNISSIASMVGYDNAFYFSRLFKKHKGLSPAEYRKIFREKYKENLQD
jgi:AraC-like DNA-binding protein